MTMPYQRHLEINVNGIRCYMFENEKYYKASGMKGSYFIKASDYEKLSIKQAAITIYQYTNAMKGLEKVKSFAKTVVKDEYELLLLAGPKISSHFKIYNLEQF